MRVALLGKSGCFNRTDGSGIRRYMYELYNNLAAQGSVSVDRIEFAPYPLMGKVLSFTLRSFLGDFSKYDIVHNPDFIPAFPRRSGKTLFTSTVHDLMFAVKRDLMKEGLRLTVDGLRERVWLSFAPGMAMRSLLSSDFLVAVSTQTRDELAALGYEKRRVQVTNLGVDDRFKVGLKKTMRKDDIFRIGYVGAYRRRKNVIAAVNAFGMTEDKKMRLMLYGRQRWLNEDIAAATARDRRIRLGGFAPENRLVSIYDGFDAFIFPSLYEGFGLPILEAQSRGLPVVIFKHGAIPREVRRHCIEAKDEHHMARILEALKGNGYKDSERRRSVAYARSFSWKKMAMETVKAYEKWL